MCLLFCYFDRSFVFMTWRIALDCRHDSNLFAVERSRLVDASSNRMSILFWLHHSSSSCKSNLLLASHRIHIFTVKGAKANRHTDTFVQVEEDTRNHNVMHLLFVLDRRLCVCLHFAKQTVNLMLRLRNILHSRCADGWGRFSFILAILAT